MYIHYTFASVKPHGWLGSAMVRALDLFASWTPGGLVLGWVTVCRWVNNLCV